MADGGDPIELPFPRDGGVELPFGGFKKSGIGREKGLAALHEYTQLKNVCVKTAS